MNLLLLGAGASKAYKDSPTNVLMPIACDFFSTFEKLDIFDNPWVLRDGLYDFVANIKKEDPDAFFSAGIDIEDFYSEVESYLKAIKGEQDFERIRVFKTYTQLVFIFSSVINNIQNGPVSSPHKELAKALEVDDVVLTFNWDTLMDRAMQQFCSWTTDIGYGFRPKSIYKEGWTAPSVPEIKAPQIIKLHGSTNWLSSHPINPKGIVELTQSSSPDTVWVYESATSPYSCFKGRFMEGFQDFSYGYYPPNILDDKGKEAPDGHVIVRASPNIIPKGNADSSGLVSIPLIIPPVRDKNYDGFGALFHDLWVNAEESLKKADHILIIGYSFPKTDIKTNGLFLKAFLHRDSIPYVTILDPNPEQVALKFKLEFGIPDSHLRVFQDYFSESTDIKQLFNYR